MSSSNKNLIKLSSIISDGKIRNPDEYIEASSNSDKNLISLGDPDEYIEAFSNSDKNLNSLGNPYEYIKAFSNTDKIIITDPNEDFNTFSNSDKNFIALADPDEDLIIFSDYSDENVTSKNSENDITSKTTEDFDEKIASPSTIISKHSIPKIPTQSPSTIISKHSIPKIPTQSPSTIISKHSSISKISTQSPTSTSILRHPSFTHPSLKKIKLNGIEYQIYFKDQENNARLMQYCRLNQNIIYIQNPLIMTALKFNINYAHIHRYFNREFKQKILTTALLNNYFSIPCNWLVTPQNNNTFFIERHINNKFILKIITRHLDENFEDNIKEVYDIKKTIKWGVFLIFIKNHSIAFFDYKTNYFNGIFPTSFKKAIDDLNFLNPFNLSISELELLKVKLEKFGDKLTLVLWDLKDLNHMPYIHAYFNYIFEMSSFM
uniref:Uncharacterized protein n=1 Tax=Orbilia brochopaga TaxID=3140254 RepID=A0A481ZLG7_9PEZI|nr:hypothetical protein [Drechslerella brochopaga]QBL02515.1 hypothetical protein [Drechslerella brochopaga]